MIDFDHSELVREINKDFAIDVMPQVSEGMN